MASQQQGGAATVDEGAAVAAALARQREQRRSHEHTLAELEARIAALAHALGPVRCVAGGVKRAKRAVRPGPSLTVSMQLLREDTKANVERKQSRSVDEREVRATLTRFTACACKLSLTCWNCIGGRGRCGRGRGRIVGRRERRRSRKAYLQPTQPAARLGRQTHPVLALPPPRPEQIGAPFGPPPPHTRAHPRPPSGRLTSSTVRSTSARSATKSTAAARCLSGTLRCAPTCRMRIGGWGEG
jgi:hypothetical protein